MQHDAPLVVGLVPEAAGDALDLLDDAVAAFGPGVRDAELQERLDPGPPLLDGAGQPSRLGHVRGRAGGQEAGEGLSGFLCKGLTVLVLSGPVEAAREHDVELVEGDLPGVGRAAAAVGLGA